MKLTFEHVSVSEAGGEIFQVLFEVFPDQENSPYLLISRAFLEEYEEDPSYIYVESDDESLIGHYMGIHAQLDRSRLTLRLPVSVNDTVDVDFTTSDTNFERVKDMLQIIFQRDI